MPAKQQDLDKFYSIIKKTCSVYDLNYLKNTMEKILNKPYYETDFSLTELPYTKSFLMSLNPEMRKAVKERLGEPDGKKKLISFAIVSFNKRSKYKIVTTVINTNLHQTVAESLRQQWEKLQRCFTCL